MANGPGGSPGFDIGRPVSFFRTVFEVLVRPAQFFARFGRAEFADTTPPVVFAIICTVISGLLAIATFPLNPLPMSGRSTLLDQDGLTIGIGLVVTVVFLVVIGVISLLVGTLVQHLLTLPFIRLGEGVKATFLVVAYGANTVSLLSWIPVVGSLALLYGVYIATVGLRELHATTTTRALLAAVAFFLVILFFSPANPMEINLGS